MLFYLLFLEVEKMNKDRKVAIWVGVLILLAYVVLVNSITDSKFLVTFFETISGMAVIGIAVLMYPYFKFQTKGVKYSYISLKSIEGLLMIIAGFLFLSSSFLLRDSIYVWHTYIFIVSAFILYVLLYKVNIIPKYLSIWGMVAAVLLLIGTLGEASGNTSMLISIIFMAPIVLNEFYLAIYLMVKGFNIK
jgi:hypothetical protein